MNKQSKESDAKASQPILTFTEAAARKVGELIDEEGNPHLCLRVFISGGGCSGFQYGFSFEESRGADDFVVEKGWKDSGEDAQGKTNRVSLLVDPLSLQYLRGAEIDYREDVKGAQFVIRNPNAKTTCGCGSSFSAEPPVENDF